MLTVTRSTTIEEPTNSFRGGQDTFFSSPSVSIRKFDHPARFSSRCMISIASSAAPTEGNRIGRRASSIPSTCVETSEVRQ